MERLDVWCGELFGLSRSLRLRAIAREQWEFLGAYRHYRSGVYSLVMIVAREDDAAPMAVYRSQSGLPFTRPLAEFAEKFRRIGADAVTAGGEGASNGR